jgi:hypothetical protein
LTGVAGAAALAVSSTANPYDASADQSRLVLRTRDAVSHGAGKSVRAASVVRGELMASDRVHGDSADLVGYCGIMRKPR